jgi:hypothetical protein
MSESHSQTVTSCVAGKSQDSGLTDRLKLFLPHTFRLCARSRSVRPRSVTRSDGGLFCEGMRVESTQSGIMTRVEEIPTIKSVGLVVKLKKIIFCLNSQISLKFKRPIFK